MDKYSFEKIDTFYKCKILLKNSYPERANAIRRILLDDIPSPALSCANSVISTTDGTLSIAEVKQIVEMIKPLDIANNDTYHLKIKNNNNEKAPVFSHNISQRLVPGIFICHLASGCHLEISNIKVDINTSRNLHVRFSAVFGNVKYKELDFQYVRRLNQNGFIENNRFPVSAELPKNTIISCKEGEKKIREDDKKLFSAHKPYYGDFIKEDCKNYELEFFTYYHPDIIIQKCKESHKQQYRDALEYELAQNGGEFSFTFKGNHTVGNEILKFLDEYRCSGDSLPFIKNKFRIIINHVDAVKIFENTVKKIMASIL